MKGIVITHDQEIKTVELSKPLHRSAGEIVGGWIEIVRPRGLNRPYIMIVNEEFLILNLPINEIGCILYETYTHGHPICGNIIIMKELGDEIVELEDFEIQVITHKLTALHISFYRIPCRRRSLFVKSRKPAKAIGTSI